MRTWKKIEDEVARKNGKNETKWILHMMIFSSITFKTHVLGLFILSFITPSHGLRYVPKKSISIKHEYFNWGAHSLKNFHKQCGIALFLFPRQSFEIIHPFWMNIEFLSAWWNSQMKTNKKKERDFRVKTSKKGSLEQRQFENTHCESYERTKRLNTKWPRNIQNAKFLVKPEIYQKVQLEI